MKVAVCLLARNEARCLLEWMAYNLVLGFDEILVYDNDSIDGTRQVVEHARKVDPRIRYFAWPDIPGLAPQRRAYNHALRRSDADWIAFIDADEFIVLREHDRIGDFLAQFDDTIGAVCLHWRIFGSSGHKTYANDLVIRRFQRCAATYDPLVKSIVRRSSVAEMRVHFAMLASGIHVAANGRQVAARCKIRQIQSEHPAFINHYLLKSVEEYRAKVARGAGSWPPDSPRRRAKYKPHFWVRFDRNEAEDPTIARLIPAVEAEMKRLGSPATADFSRSAPIPISGDRNCTDRDVRRRRDRA